MNHLKIHISSLLLIIAVSYSIDLHSLSHTFEKNHADDSNKCELCITNHQKDQNFFILEPSFNDFDLIPLFSLEGLSQKVQSAQTSYYNIYFIGQFLNRPPPFTV